MKLRSSVPSVAETMSVPSRAGLLDLMLSSQTRTEPQRSLAVIVAVTTKNPFVAGSTLGLSVKVAAGGTVSITCTRAAALPRLP